MSCALRHKDTKNGVAGASVTALFQRYRKGLVMMARRGFGRLVLGALAGVASVALSGCGLFGRNSYRFKMTVEVDTPEGMRRGSSVYEVFANNTPKLLPEEGVRQIEIKGQAVVIEFETGPIFVLMSGYNRQPTDLVEMSMRTLDPVFHTWSDSVDSAGRLDEATRRKGEVPHADWPMMVRFADINDPKSVERVDPAAVGVKRILLETTREDVTVGIERRLGWLPNQRGAFLNPLKIDYINDPPFAANITKKLFSSEI